MIVGFQLVRALKDRWSRGYAKDGIRGDEYLRYVLGA